VPHTIAVCFLRDRVSLESYTDEAAQDSGLHAFREKVKMVEHPEWEPPHISGEKFPIVIKLKDGTEHKAVFSGAVKGIRLSDDELMDRYMDCALRVLSRRSAEEGARMILTLDKVKDVSEVMDLFTFGRKNKNK